MHPDDLFFCVALHCTIRLRVCVARQLETAREMRGDLRPRSSRRKRGVGVTFPVCRSDLCAQGRAIRDALGEEVATSVRHGSRDKAAFLAWAEHERQRVRLGEPPTIDSHLARK